MPSHFSSTAAVLGALPSASSNAAETVAGEEALAKAFEALATFDWGTGITIPEPGKPPTDSRVLAPIEDAAIAARGDAAAAQALEARLAAVLQTDAPRAAKDFVCRTLRMVGTAKSVPALAALLLDPDLAHMARYALELNSAPEAAAALRDALPKLKSAQLIGTIGSLGKRRDAASVSQLAPLLADNDQSVAAAAAAALGIIGTAESAAALSKCLKDAPGDLAAAATDACLICAEQLLVDGQNLEALALYKSLSSPDQPPHVRVAIARGMLSVAGKKE